MSGSHYDADSSGAFNDHLDPNAMGRQHGYVGRWKDPTTPKTGWDCQDVMTDQAVICQMCLIKPIKNAYRMVHPAWQGHLDVGSECGGWMTNSDQKIEMRRAMKRKLGHRTDCRSLITDCGDGLGTCTDRAYIARTMPALDSLMARVMAGNGPYEALRDDLRTLLVDITLTNQPLPSPSWKLNVKGNYHRWWSNSSGISATVYQDHRRSGLWALIMNVDEEKVSSNDRTVTATILTNRADRTVAAMLGKS